MSIVRIFLFRAGVVRATVPVQLYARGADLVTGRRISGVRTARASRSHRLRPILPPEVRSALTRLFAYLPRSPFSRTVMAALRRLPQDLALPLSS